MNTARPTGQHGAQVDPQRRLAGSIPAINRPTSTVAPSTYYESDPAGTLSARRGLAGEFYYYLDGPGSVLGLIDTNGTVQARYTYDPYGVTTAVGGPNGNLSNTNPYRYYHQPTLGRWTQQDDLNVIGDPANADRYTWAAGDPVNNVDPSGMCSGFFGCAAAVFDDVEKAIRSPAGCALTTIGVGLGVAALGILLIPATAGTSATFTFAAAGVIFTGGVEAACNA